MKKAVDPKELKSVFDSFFWMDEADILYAILFKVISKIAVEAGEVAAVGIGVSWNLVNEAVVDWARNFVAEEVVNITTVTQRMVQNTVTEWIGASEPLSVLEKDPRLLDAFGKVRAKRIAVTEVTNAYAGGNLEAFKKSGVVDGKEWRTAGMDVCPICMGLDGQQQPLEAPFFSEYDGSLYDRPPAHVNCRCWIQPVVNKIE